jgi:diguanylate cyclase (GGDEF)-like protein/PAS domain S-box-containing protein
VALAEEEHLAYWRDELREMALVLTVLILASLTMSLLIVRNSRADARLQASEANLRRAQTVAGVGSWHLDVMRNHLWWSEETYRIFGVPLGPSLKYETFLERIHPDDCASVDKAWQAALQGAPYDVEHRIIVEGAIKWVRERADLEFDAQGKLRRGVGTVQDITERKQIEEALRESEHNFRLFFDSIDDLVFVVDEQSRILKTNPMVSERLDYTEAELLGQNLLDVHPLEWRAEAARIVADILAGKTIYCPIPLCARNGQLIPVETRVFPGTWSGRKVLFGVTKDLSELKASEEKFAKAFYINPALMAISTLEEGRFVEVNETFLRTLGYTWDEVIGKTSQECGMFADPQQRTYAIQILREHGRLEEFDIQVRTRSGELRHGLFSASFLRLQNQDLLLTVMIDVTALKDTQARLEQMAYYDALTGLPNRVLLEDRLQVAIAQTQRESGLLAVGYLDLDGFKPVNDKWGHTVGDELLIQVAQRLKACMRGGDTVCRLGGDEFVILLCNLRSAEECQQALNRILSTLTEPFQLIHGEVHLSASIGVTLYPRDGAAPDTLVRHADQAMYAAKLAGRNRYCLFNAERDSLSQRQAKSTTDTSK